MKTKGQSVEKSEFQKICQTVTLHQIKKIMTIILQKKIKYFCEFSKALKFKLQKQDEFEETLFLVVQL